MSAEELYSKEEYDEALSLYTQAIQQNSKNFEFFEKRATCFIKLAKFEEAIKDADQAIQLSPDNIYSYLRKGIAHFSLEQYESSKTVFQNGLKYAKPSSEIEKQLSRWIRKADCELPLVTKTQPSILPISQQNDGTTKPPAAIKHNWYQNNDQVIVSILYKNLKPDDINVQLGESSLDFIIKTTPSTLHLHLDFFDLIVPAQSKHQIFGTKVEFTLIKKNAGSQWAELEKVQTPKKEILSSPYASKKDWNGLDKEVKLEIEAEKPEGDQALNALFKKIYAGADDDTRRAMQKSYVESNGTVLSTNWKEVGAKKVEGSPPKGMEFTKYEQ